MARPKLADEGDSVPITARVPAKLDKAVRAFQVETGLGRSEAIRELLERGLTADKPAKPRSRASISREPSAEVCRHPSARRIGDGCGACGDPKAHAKAKKK